MSRSIGRIIAAIAVAAIGIYLGLSLALYADKDDSPGGMVIGVLLMFGSLGLALWIGLRQRRGSPSEH